MRSFNYYLQYVLMAVATLISVGISLLVILFVVSQGIFLINWNFITSIDPEVGIFPMIVSTVIIVCISVFVAFWVALLTALYLQEYSKRGWFQKIVVFSIDSLVSVPSIVYGLFGMTFFVNNMRFGFSILSGSLTVGIMVLPILINTIIEALKFVPNDLKMGSYALGANKFQTIFKVIIPYILNNIFTAIILAITRVVGESAPFILTAGAALKMPTSIFSSARTITTHMYLLINEGIAENSIELAYASGTILILIVLFLSLIMKFMQYKMGGNK